MAWRYYIDGYNVLHFSAWLRPAAGQDFERARETLIEKVAQFCVGAGVSAKIVFDGRGSRRGSQDTVLGVPGLEVHYSAEHLSADALIERLVYRATDRRSIVVVSHDRGIRTLCQGLGALVMDPNHFLATCRETRQNLQQVVRHDHVRLDRTRLEDRLDERSHARLLHLRRELQG